MNQTKPRRGILKTVIYGGLVVVAALAGLIIYIATRPADFVVERSGNVNAPPEQVFAMFDDIAVWSTRPDFAGTGFTRFVIELADLPGHPARVIARRHKALLEFQFADILKGAKVPLAERRARELMLLVEGAVVMLLIHRDRRYVAAAAEVAKRLVAARLDKEALIDRVNWRVTWRGCCSIDS